LRLSIHESVGGTKLSISLLNTKTGFTTPWHCSVAQLADGEWVSAPMGEFSKDDRMELVYVDGRPSHFREKPREGDAFGISESTAGYLKQAKRLSASEYLSSASTSVPASPGMISSNSSISSSFVSVEASASTSPEPESPPSFALNGMEIAMEDKLSNTSLPEQTNETASVAYGKRLIPQIMDSLAAAEPERIVFSLTTFSGDSLELRHISARAFTKAVDKTAWWLYNQVGKPDSIQPIGYIGPRKLAKSTSVLSSFR
jgi:hypothetical protein